HDVVEPFGPLQPLGELELGVRLGKSPLRSRDSLSNRGLRREESSSDLGGGEPADQSQRERGPRLWRQRRMARQENEPEHVVFDVVELALDVGHRLLLSPSGTFELRDLAPKTLGATKVIDGAPL